MAITITQLRAVFEGDTQPFDRAADHVEKRLSGMPSRLNRLGGILSGTVTPALIALGAAGLRAGLQLDSAFDQIRVATGATGQAFESLQASFRNVAKDAPSDFNQVADAIGQIHQRLGLTGKELETFAAQQLDLARITGGSVAEGVRQATRTLGDWGIKVKDAAAAQDLLFRVSQRTGIQMTRLQQLLVQYGAPLRGMGFSFVQAAAMLGKFEREGVNTELVLGSLRIALTRMAKAGITDAGQALSQIVTKIQAAGSAAQANTLAVQVFGSRAGPDMAAAIREGRLELDALVKSVTKSGDTIRGVAKETEDFGEAWTRLRNRVTLALEPLGESLMRMLGRLVDMLKPAAGAAESLSESFAKLSPAARDTSVSLGAVAAAVGPVVLGIGFLRKHASAFGPAAVKFVTWLTSWKGALAGAAVGLSVLSAVAVSKLGGVTVVLDRIREGFGSFVQGLGVIGEAIGRAGKMSLPEVGRAFGQLWRDFPKYWRAGLDVIKGKGQELAGAHAEGWRRMGAVGQQGAKEAATETAGAINAGLAQVNRGVEQDLSKLTDTVKKKGADRLAQEKRNAAAELAQWQQYLKELAGRRTEALKDDARPLLRAQLRERYPRRSEAEIEAAVTREVGLRRLQEEERQREERARKLKQDVADTARTMKSQFEREAKERIARHNQGLKAEEKALEDRFNLQKVLSDRARQVEEDNRRQMTEHLRAYSEAMKARAREAEDSWKPLTESLTSVFGNAFRDVESGFGGMVRSITQGFRRMLVDLAAEYLASELSRLIFGVVGQATGIKIPVPGSTLGNLKLSAAGAGGGGGGGPAWHPPMPLVSTQGAGRAGAAGDSSTTVNINVRGEQTTAARQNAAAVANRAVSELSRQKRRLGY